MKKPVLVIMAAGMGSRYGGLKQIDPVDEQGHIIMDFSIYDAKRAGFEKVVFIIKKENEADFKEAIGNRIEKVMDVAYAFQNLANIPEGYEVPAERVKPWGTAHAVLSCKDIIDGPFAVINADDYYGRDAFQKIYDYLSTHEDDEKYRYTMVGYQLENTLTENGHVARGVCEMNEAGELVSVTECLCKSSSSNELFTIDLGFKLPHRQLNVQEFQVNPLSETVFKNIVLNRVQRVRFSCIIDDGEGFTCRIDSDLNRIVETK